MGILGESRWYGVDSAQAACARNRSLGESMDEPIAEDSAVERSNLDFPVVGIGASAGGIDALRRLLEQMPKEPDFAIVVILHLSPRHESSAAEVLQSATQLQVQQVKHTVAIERNKVYVIPPTQDLSMSDGHLVLSDAVRPLGRHIVIDTFFRTLAEAHRDRAVGIVLSGTGADGSMGIGWLKQYGGVVLAQSPDDAQHDGMPMAAIATGHVDIVLPAADIAQRLGELWANAQRIELPDAAASDLHAKESTGPEAAEAALQAVLVLVRQRTGHDFKHYKRATLLRRIERRLQVTGTGTLPEYRDFLTAHSQETQALLGDLLIGVTQFFRDRASFEALEREVVPALFKEAFDRDQLRVWVAGVSTGQEAYSISILLADQAKQSDVAKRLTIFATDIDEHAIEVAREGRYPEAIVADMTPARLRNYFTKDGAKYRIAKPQRDMIVFATHNVLRDPPFSKVDLITCRNLLIYLDRSAQQDVLQMFHFSLRPGGYLFLGTSETPDAASDLFTVVDKGHRIYRAKSMTGHLRGSRYFGHAAAAPEPSVPTAVKPRATKRAEQHQRMLEELGSASVVLTMDHEMAFLAGRTDLYLRFAQGAPTTDILAAARPELRQALRVCLYQAAQSTHRIESPLVPLLLADGPRLVRMSARKGKDIGWSGEMILLTFDELPDVPATTKGSDGSPRDLAFDQMEGELLRRTEQLQTTVEQYEAAGEELKAGNEELQSINEELRAATEELETSKEELQSTNEELVTVNSEMKAKAEAMAVVNDNLTNLIAVTEIATIFVDEKMHIKSFTPASTGIFSIRDTDVGRALFDITHKLEYPALADDAQSVFKTLKGVEREVRATDGRWFIARLLPYRTSDNAITGVVLTFIDISNQFAKEGVRRGSAESMQSEFLAVMSHELKHPLNLISVNAELLTKLPEAQASERLLRAAQTIRRTVKGQARIIDDLLDLSRTATGKLRLDVAPLLLTDAIKPAVESARVEAQAKGITLKAEGLDATLLVDGDPVRVEQVAWNLLSNAIKFTRSGGSITVRVREDGGDGVFEVQDTGRGVVPELLPHIFEMFRQDESATRRQEGGLGIGLALVKSLVELHGGDVSAASEGAGRGATFTVRIPLRERSAFTPLSEADSALGELGGVRILLVDDNNDTLETFSTLLEASGATVTAASSGEAALQANDQHEFDLIISDIGMPGMDGYELIEKLRCKPQTAAVPAIALTGFGRPQDVKQAIASGFNAHLDKPVDFDALRRVLAQLRIHKS